MYFDCTRVQIAGKYTITRSVAPRKQAFLLNFFCSPVCICLIAMGFTVLKQNSFSSVWNVAALIYHLRVKTALSIRNITSRLQKVPRKSQPSLRSIRISPGAWLRLNIQSPNQLENKGSYPIVTNSQKIIFVNLFCTSAVWDSFGFPCSFFPLYILRKWKSILKLSCYADCAFKRTDRKSVV